MKTCYTCHQEKPLSEFYKHPGMSDGHLGQCKSCNKAAHSAKNGSQERICTECDNEFRTTTATVKEGYGKTCSTFCRGKLISKIRNAANKDMQMGYAGVHAWIKRVAGQPKYCEFCKTTKGTFDWSNKSGKYLRDLSDWQRLCRSCHIAFDDNPTKRKETLMARYGTLSTRGSK